MKNENQLTTEELQDALAQLITGEYTDEDPICWENIGIKTFEAAGLMTNNNGLVLTMPDGSEYQLTITRRR